MLKYLDKNLERLANAIDGNASSITCLRYWSSFIRRRDGYRCVDCHSNRKVEAHHIFRKSLVPHARLLPGNGITLCNNCHKQAHRGFYAAPNLTLPVDAEGGEKLPDAERFLAILWKDAFERQLPLERYYYLSPSFFTWIGLMHGISDISGYPGIGPQRAHTMLASGFPAIRQALLRANGFSNLSEPCLAGNIHIQLDCPPTPTQSSPAACW